MEACTDAVPGAEPVHFLSPRLAHPLRRRLWPLLDESDRRAMRAACAQLRREVNAAVRRARLYVAHLILYHPLNLSARFPKLHYLELDDIERRLSPAAMRALHAFAAEELSSLSALKALSLRQGKPLDLTAEAGIAEHGNALATALQLLLAAPPGLQRLAVAWEGGEALLPLVAARFAALQELEVTACLPPALSRIGQLSGLRRLAIVAGSARSADYTDAAAAAAAGDDNGDGGLAAADADTISELGDQFCEALSELRALTGLESLSLDCAHHEWPKEAAVHAGLKELVAALPDTCQCLSLACNMYDIASWCDTYHIEARMLPLGGNAASGGRPAFAAGALRVRRLDFARAGCLVEILCDLLHNQPAVRELAVGTLLRAPRAPAVASFRRPCTHVESLRLTIYATDGGRFGDSRLLQFSEDFASIFPNLKDLEIRFLDGGAVLPGRRLAGLHALRRLTLPAGTMIIDAPSDLLMNCSIIHGKRST